MKWYTNVYDRITTKFVTTTGPHDSKEEAITHAEKYGEDHFYFVMFDWEEKE